MHNYFKDLKLQALFYYIFCLLILRWQIILNPSGGFLGGVTGDPGIYTYLAKVNFQNYWFELNSFYPYNYALGWSDTFLFPSFLIQGLTLLGINFVLSYNLVLLLTQIANGFCTYLLARKYSGNFLSSLIAGLALMSSQFLFAHLGHPQLQFFFFIPLGLYYLEKGLCDKSKLGFLLNGIIITLAFLSCSYYGIFLALLSCILIFLDIIKNYKITRKLSLILPGVLCLLPFVNSYLKVQDAFGERFLHEPQAFSATLISYLNPASSSWLGQFLPSLSHGEAQLYIGVIGVLTLIALIKFFIKENLLIIGALLCITIICSSLQGSFRILTGVLGCLSFLVLLVSFFRRSSTNKKIILLLVFSFLITLGPLGINKFGDHAYSLHRIIYEVFPGFSAIRAISRFGIISILFLTIYFACSYQISKKIFILLTIVLLIEAAPRYLPVEKLTQAPAAVNEIITGEYSGAVLVLPFTGELNSSGKIVSWSEFANLNVKYMNWFADSKLKLLNGYSGQRSNLMEQLPEKLVNFPDPTSLTTLKKYPGVNYVIDLRNTSSKSSEPTPLKIFPDSSKIYRISHNFGEGEMFVLASKTKAINYYAEKNCSIKLNFEDGNFFQEATLNSGNQILNIKPLEARVSPYKFKFTSNCGSDFKFLILDVIQ